MKHQFDELTKSLAQSVTRRAALKKFGLGLAGMTLACFGLANRAEAAPPSDGSYCRCHKCKTQLKRSDPNYWNCVSICSSFLGC